MKKLKKIVILGFPNVGKSTLFNRLLKKKKSLVHSLQGMTRDVVSDACQIEEKSFTLIDTGGFFDSKEDVFSPKVKEKAWEAAQEADVVLFVLDGKRALLPAEEELYFSVKKLNKPIIVVVNKIDTPSEEDKVGEFFKLGSDRLICVSAEHKRNIELLEAGIEEILPETDEEDGEKDSSLLKIAIVGRINVGKSSLVNRLSGLDKMIVSEIPGTTRDSIDSLIQRDKKKFTLVDTAGIRKLSRMQDKREQASVIKAKQDIMRADVICLILDAQEFPTRQDTAIAHLAYESGKPLIIGLNKWDLIPKESNSSKEFKEMLFSKLEFVSYAPVIFISALSGQRTVKILDLAEQVYANASKQITTSKLNIFLSWLHVNHPPISKKGAKFKIKYMTQKKVNPPGFLLFTHSKASFAPSYEKHFINLLRERFELFGTPIWLSFRRN
ncbi:MAG: ribosome biogenesis GTPase Der [Candidatus Aminicenantes bacterium]|nr:ribosome biogenesis GTPase Der [Candidatus Aminicenantes bacterium]